MGLRQRSLSLLLDFVIKEVTLDDAVKFHNDMVDLFRAYHKIIESPAKKIEQGMKLKDIWHESRTLLHWILFNLNKGVVSDELAHDIFGRFFHAYMSDRVLTLR